MRIEGLLTLKRQCGSSRADEINHNGVSAQSGTEWHRYSVLEMGSWSSGLAIRFRPHRSGRAAFAHPALPGSHPHQAVRGVQGGDARERQGRRAVTSSNQSQPMRRFFWLRRCRHLNQIRRMPAGTRPRGAGSRDLVVRDRRASRQADREPCFKPQASNHTSSRSGKQRTPA